MWEFLMGMFFRDILNTALGKMIFFSLMLIFIVCGLSVFTGTIVMFCIENSQIARYVAAGSLLIYSCFGLILFVNFRR